MSMIDEIRNTLNEIQVALAAKVEDLQHAITTLHQHIAQTQTGAALACHNANEAANAS